MQDRTMNSQPTPNEHGPATPDGGLTSKQRIGLVIALAIIALIIAIPIANWAGSPETYSNTINVIDTKKDNVTGLAATAAGASTALTILPGDIGTPIAQNIADLSSNLLLILSVLYFEKFLITVFGLIACRVMIPLGILELIAALLLYKKPAAFEFFIKIGSKLILFGIALAVFIPLTAWTCALIDSTYEANIAAAQEQAEAASAEISNEAGSGDAASGEAKDLWGTISDTASSIAGGITKKFDELKDMLANALSSMLDVVAIMVVTSCIVPIVILLLLIWLMRTLTGFDIKLPIRRGRPRV